MRATDPELAIDDIRSMDTRIAESLIARRSPALLAGIFAGVALLLAAIGTYGVLSYAVAQRRREIGIRMALGAARSSVLGLVMKQGLQLTIIGVLVGLAGAFGLGRLIASLLYDVAPTDPATMAAVIMVNYSDGNCRIRVARVACVSTGPQHSPQRGMKGEQCAARVATAEAVLDTMVWRDEAARGDIRHA